MWFRYIIPSDVNRMVAACFETSNISDITAASEEALALPFVTVLKPNVLICWEATRLNEREGIKSAAIPLLACTSFQSGLRRT